MCCQRTTLLAISIALGMSWTASLWGQKAQESDVSAIPAPPANVSLPATTTQVVPGTNIPIPFIAPGPVKPKLSALAEIPDWKQLESLSDLLTKEEFEQAFKTFYSDRSNFPVPWRIEGNTLIVETSPGKAPVRITFRETSPAKPKHAMRYWRSPQELPPLQPGEPVLTGVHIALDPGHIGGGFARLEERWLSMNPGEEIMEGSIMMALANMLKPRLEALGAQVTLVRTSENPVTETRPENLKETARAILHDAGITSPQETYADNQNDARILTVQWQSEKLFYRVSEIRARAEKVNTKLRPDVVLCLHLNAEAWGDPAKPAFVDKNHLHLLINGCYSADELQYEDVRFEMLQRLFSRTHEQEVAMADVVATDLAKTTGLPAFVYLTNNAKRVSENPYVFSRNLLASRLYECPVLYFEPYVMNHEQTYKRLLLGHFIGRTLLGTELVTSPMEDYARGVLEGLTDFYSKARK